MKVLIACEESQAVTKAFRKLGHEAFSCDILPCSGGHPEWHLQQDVLGLLEQQWDIIIAFPDCTYLCVTANKWFKDQPLRKSGVLVGAERRHAREKAAEFFMKLYNSSCKKIAIENPVGVMSTRFRKPDQIIQPFQFGHPESKKTCLWLKGLKKLEATDIVEQELRMVMKSGKTMPTWYALPKQSAERQKMRSKTFPGIAKAMAEQWGRCCGINPPIKSCNGQAAELRH